MANLSKDIQCAGFDTRPPMLDRTDFGSWQQRIQLYCWGKENGVGTLRETRTKRTEDPSTKRKLRFIRGTVIRSTTEANLAELWDTCNNMLEKRFSLSDGSRKYKLNKDTYEINQSGSSVGEYYTRMKCVWEEFNNLNVLPTSVLSVVSNGILLRSAGRRLDIHHGMLSTKDHNSQDNQEQDRLKARDETKVLQEQLLMWKVDPVNFKEVAADPSWYTAMDTELKSLEENDGTVYRKKARLVVQVAAIKGWFTCQMDVCNAFLHGDLLEEVYMKPLMGYTSKGKNVSADTTLDSHLACKLKKSLYGLKQAPRQRFSKLLTTLLEFGYTQSKINYSLFVKKEDASFTIVLVYVDDQLITDNDESQIGSLKAQLSFMFHMNDLDDLS
uniref:Reverse transcriptase Ty1/copia-type domain-containing protein n=1 Tax=Tanacetum cinerariifolium TaxID=118510 RepID=A0A699H4L1_TANCI|nr:hypothetical protein [Tanacetum cinerariifolium]